MSGGCRIPTDTGGEHSAHVPWDTLLLHISLLICVQLVQHFLAGHLGRMSKKSLFFFFKMLALRDLAWWREQKRDCTKSRRHMAWSALFWFLTAGAGERVFKSVSNLPSRPTDSDQNEFGWSRVAQTRQAWTVPRVAFAERAPSNSS